MPTKIKILLFTMTAGAGLIVFSVFANVKNVSNLGANINQTLDEKGNSLNPDINEKNSAKINSKSCSDIDKDGLCDNEETIYGTDPLNPDTDGDRFLDGEEVAAGCSPLIPKPDDCSISKGTQKLNLTEYFSFLMTGLFPFEKLDQSGPEFEKSVKILSDEASRIQKTFLSIDDSSIQTEVSKDNSKTASQNYLNETDRILEKYFSKSGEEINTEGLDGLYNELSKLKPAPNLEDFHKKLLKFFVKLKVYTSNLSEEKEDPIKVLLTLDNTDNLLNEYKEIRTEIRAIHSGPSGSVVPVNDGALIKLLHDIHDRESTAREKGRKALQILSDYIINVIKDMGRKGQIGVPDAGSNFFVQNFRNLSLEGQYRGENLWRGLLAVAAEGEPNSEISPLLCKHIRESEAFRSLLPTKVTGSNILESGVKRSVSPLDDYLVKTKCDSFVDQNYETFINDFAAGGGWEMWEKMLQPQNNIFGMLAISLDELEKQKKIEEQADTNEVLSGSGYLGLRQCLSFGPSGQCVIWGPAAIPSNLAVATLVGVINQNLAFLADISRRDPATIDSELSAIAEYFSNQRDGIIPRIFGFEGFGPSSPQPPPPPGPGPGPGPNPNPPPPPTGGQPASLLSDVKAERAKYSEITFAGLCDAPGDPRCPLGKILNAIAWKNQADGWGLSGKNFGYFVTSPIGSIASDILYHKPTNIIVDVFENAGTFTKPIWDILGPNTQSNRPWVAPVQP